MVYNFSVPAPPFPGLRRFSYPELTLIYTPETWVEHCLVPVLNPGQIVVMDNATFHKGGIIEALIESAGAQVWYLPSYSPDFNKIERCWSWLKSRIRHCISEFDSLREAMEHVLKIAS